MKLSSTPLRRERGAILVTCLLLLLILTVLGVAMMRMTNMQERMAGNTRDMNLALQGAEAALRDAERKLSPAVTSLRPAATSALGCEYCQQATLPVDLDDPAQFDWDAYAREFGTAAQEITNLDEDPRYTIEEAGFVRDSLVASEPPTGRDFYTITSRSTGASGQANTVLQSTYARRF